MPGREEKAIAKACRWLLVVPIAPQDLDRHVLRLFALAVSRASPAQLQRCARLLPEFTWFQYHGDPVAALIGERALKSVGHVHSGLAALKEGYRSLLTGEAQSLPLLCRLLEMETSFAGELNPPSAFALVTAPRERVLEFCRDVTMATCGGTESIAIHEAAQLLPRLAFSYARDWDIEVASSVMRACVYLNCEREPACQWTLEWLLDQQQADGRFGLLQAEAKKCGWSAEDWCPHFDRTVHALWTLSELTGKSGLRVAG